MNFRDVTDNDIASITAIYSDSVANGVASYELTAPDEAEMAHRREAIIKDGYPYFVAQEAGEILGYAYASAFRTRPAYRWLCEDSIYLAPAARGRGIGFQLLGELVSRCQERGFRQMVAVIGGAHPASVRLHLKAGFTQTGLLKGTGFKHGRWLDTLLMQKSLGAGTGSDPDPASYPGTLFGG